MLYVNGIFISLVSEYMLRDLGADGTFMYYSIVTMVGAIIMFKYMKETEGLTDKQKKRLYFPKALRGEGSQGESQTADSAQLEISIETIDDAKNGQEPQTERI